MSKKTPSQGFSYNFEIVFDKEKETTLQKIKRWISKQKPPFDTILKYLFSYIEKWYWDGKVLQTMAGVDLEVEKLHELWEEDDRQITPHVVETGVFGDLVYPNFNQLTKRSSEIKLVTSSNVRSVEKDEGEYPQTQNHQTESSMKEWEESIIEIYQD